MKLNAKGGSFSGVLECHGVLWGVSCREVSRGVVMACGGVSRDAVRYREVLYG